MNKSRIYDPNRFVEDLLKTFEEIERIRNNRDLIFKTKRTGPSNGNAYSPVLETRLTANFPEVEA